MWRKARTGQLAADDAAILVSAFEFDYHGDDEVASIFAILAVDESMLVGAARQAARHGLRAYDAVQLACATAARSADASIDTLAAFDAQLRTAAMAEGFSVLDAG